MSVWMEMRCEGRREPDSFEPYRCLSHDNDGPTADADETQVSVLKNLSAMRVQARNEGWRHAAPGLWICPECAKRKGFK